MANTYQPVSVLHLDDMAISPLGWIGFDDGPVLQEYLTHSNPRTLKVTYMLFYP